MSLMTSIHVAVDPLGTVKRVRVRYVAWGVKDRKRMQREEKSKESLGLNHNES